MNYVKNYADNKIFRTHRGLVIKILLLIFCLPIAMAENQFDKISEYKIGDKGPAGGIIFYERKNTDSGDWKYLELAPLEAEFVAQWGAYTIPVPLTKTEIGSGYENTEIISAYLTSLGETYRASQICSSLEYGGFDDWFIPSKDELNLVYENITKRNLGDMANNWYWTSSTYDEERYCWYQRFSDGFQTNYFRFVPYLVRPIRFF